MKFVRKFNNISERTAVLQKVNYNILSYTNGVGINLKTDRVDPAYATPFYVENPHNDTVKVYFSYEFSDETGGSLVIPIEYSYDKSLWTSIGTLTGDNTETSHIQIEPNQRVYFRANTPSWTEGEIIDDQYNNYGAAYLNEEGVYTLTFGGNIMSLIYGSNFTGRETTFPANTFGNFSWVLSDAVKTYDASNLILPATELTEGCYVELLYQEQGNTLANAPILAKATTLAESCYYRVTGLEYQNQTTAREDSIAYIDNPLYDLDIHGLAISYSVS